MAKVHYHLREGGDPDFYSDATVNDTSVNLYGVHVGIFDNRLMEIPELFISYEDWCDGHYGYRFVPGTNERVRVSRCSNHGILWVPANSETWFEDGQHIIKYVRSRGVNAPFKLRTMNISITPVTI